MATFTASTSALRSSAARSIRTARRGVVSVKAVAKPHWLPGTERRDYLDAADLPGNFAFDPLGFGQDPKALAWFQQAELMNGRWAMLGVAGILFPELGAKLGGITGPAGQVAWFDVANTEFWAPAPTLEAISFFLFLYAESRRLMDMAKPGSVDQDPFFPNNKVTGAGVGYPGFDPLGYMKGDENSKAVLKVKEIKNARLAMLAFAGFVAQRITTGDTPLNNLSQHLSDPWAINVFTNEHARLL